MSSKPMMSIHREGDVLVVRCPMSLSPRLPKLYGALRRSAGHPQLIRAAFAVLVQAIFLCAPTLEDAARELDENTDEPSRIH